MIVAGTSLVTWDDGGLTQAADVSFMADASAMSDGSFQDDPLTGFSGDGSLAIVNPDALLSSLLTPSDRTEPFAFSLQEVIPSLSLDGDDLAIFIEQWSLGSGGHQEASWMLDGSAGLPALTCNPSKENSWHYLMESSFSA